MAAQQDSSVAIDPWHMATLRQRGYCEARFPTADERDTLGGAACNNLWQVTSILAVHIDQWKGFRRAQNRSLGKLGNQMKSCLKTAIKAE